MPTNEALERKLVEEFFQKNKDKRARGHSYWRTNDPVIYGIIVGVGSYDLGRTPPMYGFPGRAITHWTVVIEETLHGKGIGLKHLVVFSSVQILEAGSNQVAHSREGTIVRPTQKDVEAGVKAAEEMLAKVKVNHCHAECTDGYCHRAYMSGIIRAKEIA